MMVDIILLPSWKTVFVLSVDGLQVPAGEPAWKTPLRLAPGLRTVTVMYEHLGHAIQSTFPLNAVPGAEYVVDFDTPVYLSYGTPEEYVDFWIVDKASGQAVTAHVRETFGYSVDDGYSDDDNLQASSVDFAGTQHVRPPYERGGVAGGGQDRGGGGSPGKGGPPSIPNRPRPGGGGGGSSSGGSHGGGGGGGGSRGGGGGSGGGGGGDHKK
jgi:hypothetical protein